MKYAPSIKNNLIIIISSVALFLLSPIQRSEISVQEVEAKTITENTKTITWWVVNEFQTWWRIEEKKRASWENKILSWWTEKHRNIAKNVEKQECWVDCKISKLIELGMNDRISGSLVATCKNTAKDARHCIIVGASILKSESNLWKKCNGYNCFWMWGGSTKYDSYEDGVEHWVEKYNRWWYKASSASFFYPSVWQYSPSRYCVSEVSSWSDVGCPFWQKISQSMWNKLDSLF